jgi:hypothetical protein
MNTARLDAIYGTLLAHCLRLNEAMAAATRKRFGEVEGKEVPALVDASEICEVKSAARIKFINERIEPDRSWHCVKHQFPCCTICSGEVFTPELDAVSDDLITFVANELCRLAEYYPPRRISICSVPSEYGMLLAAAYLARHFDLTEVPGFYMETAPAAPLPGASDETQMIGWLKHALDCPWRINFPKQMMQQQRTTLRTEGENENVSVREAPYAVPSSAVLVPYDSGTGFIVGLQIYPTLRSKPFLLSSRGLPGGAAAVACRV